MTSSKVLANALSSTSGVLVGNKTDLDERRVVTEKDARQFAEDNSLEYFETSAVSILCFFLFSILFHYIS